MDVQVMQLRLRLSVRKCNLGLTEISFLRPPVAAFRSADKYKKLLRECAPEARDKHKERQEPMSCRIGLSKSDARQLAPSHASCW